MRPYTLLSVAALALAACSASSPNASLTALQSCETRELTLDGVDMVIQANIDRTPASITIVRAPDDDVRTKAFQDARKLFGDPRLDTRTQTRQFKWGMVQVVDMCGRPVMPTPVPSPA